MCKRACDMDCMCHWVVFFFSPSSCLLTVPGNLGCFKDSGDPPTLSGTSETSNKLTIQNCISFCRKQRYKVGRFFSNVARVYFILLKKFNCVPPHRRKKPPVNNPCHVWNGHKLSLAVFKLLCKSSAFTGNFLTVIIMMPCTVYALFIQPSSFLFQTNQRMTNHRSNQGWQLEMNGY